MATVKRIADHCGACREFHEDFTDTDKGVVYGHCRVKTRTAAITDETYKCPEYRPVPEIEAASRPTPAPRLTVTPEAPRQAPSSAPRPGATDEPPPRTPAPPPAAEAGSPGLPYGMLRDDMRRMFRQVVTEIMGIAAVPMAERYRGGKVLIQPRNRDLQTKEIDIDAFFHKVVMVRDRLRVLEAKINGHKGLDDADKVDLQQYITRCYGSLTTFNVLFMDEDDRFVGEKTR